MVASQTPPTSGRGSMAGGGPAALPLVATTTVFLVSDATPAEALPPGARTGTMKARRAECQHSDWRSPDMAAHLTLTCLLVCLYTLEIDCRVVQPRGQVRTRDGWVSDTLELADDFVHLSHNAGVAACGERIAVLGLRSQTIHVQQVPGPVAALLHVSLFNPANARLPSTLPLLERHGDIRQAGPRTCCYVASAAASM